MNSTTKSVWQKIMSVGAILLVLGFSSSCSKKLMPPEIESGSGAPQVSDAGGSGGGIAESGFSDASGGGAGDAGSAGDGFNIQEQPSGAGGGFFVEENVGEKGGAGAGSGADISAGSGLILCRK